jgi:hypothetical protein
MSKIEVNAIEPQSGTTLTLGASGDTITIPAGATISNSGTAAGFGPTGAVSWNTTKITANPNPAVTGVGYFCDTTTAAFTVTLPATPAAGAVVGIADYANTFATNNITVGRNGSNIGGLAENAILKVNGVSVTFVYVDATQGWIVTDSGQRSNLDTAAYVAATGGTITTCGNYKIHTFTGPGSFVVSSGGNSGGSNSVDYIIVAGGGGGGKGHGGGGGAGGYRESKSPTAPWTASPLASSTSLPVAATTYPITVGAGGAASSSNTARGGCGTSSIFSTITSAGGGAGATGDNVPTLTGLSGGSGGGGSSTAPFPSNAGGSGNTPPVAPPQGNSGGTGISDCTSYRDGGGGGGATVAGSTHPAPSSPPTGNPGGTGATTSISGSPTAYAGGGGGGGTSNAGTGGTGGGGNGGRNCAPSPTRNATTNTGGGGGGSGGAAVDVGGSGGSGIVVIRYKFQ